MPSAIKPNVFISYSWDSSEHQEWVISLADLINAKGGNAIVDRLHLKYGGHIKTFMLKSIIDSDFVLIILTPNYKRKADALEGGAGYEYNIINDELFKIITINEKYIPILRQGNITESTTNFLRGFNCLDLRAGEGYMRNLEELINIIIRPQIKKADKTINSIDLMENRYRDIGLVAQEAITNAHKYFQQLFIVDDNAESTKNLNKVVKEWEKEVREYHLSFIKQFSPQKMLVYEDYMEDFKNKVFARDLWTVGAALKTPDPDLARYKKDYRSADTEEIFNTVNGILLAARNYAEFETPQIEYNDLKSPSDLNLEFLDEDGMFMNKIIGFGIRSEILHRYYPSFFPIMTQPNLWAMYFICESDNEFITIENKIRDKKMRVSHNWQYPYDRFTFLMTVISNALFKWLGDYGIELEEKLRFGYVNKFLSKITDLHKSDIKMLHEWIDTQ